ncbi:acyltransferase family protein [Actinomycetes bacterium M1A6_2h]
MSTDSTQRRFLPALEGMRGLAALGVLVTHVAFQTATTDVPIIGRVLGRFDLAVALFFGLSGFLLWRPHAAAARGLRRSPPVGRYFLSRAIRILPAYWVVVCVVLLLLPQAGGGARVWFANLTLTQVFFPLTLTQGMTQMWSLSVEVAFYLVLPLGAAAVAGLRGPRVSLRVPLLVCVAVLSLGWAFLPIRTAEATNIQNWMPGYLPWFLTGAVIAELASSAAVDGPGRLQRWAGRRTVMTTIAAVAFLVSTTDLAGPEGLVTPAPWQYAIKIALGSVVAFGLLAPIVFADGHRRYRYLDSPFGLMLGRWSYGLFVWHLAVLAIVFPVFGIIPFTGHFLLVTVVTTVLSVLIASASYALVEEPARLAFSRWEAGRAHRATQSTATSAQN